MAMGFKSVAELSQIKHEISLVRRGWGDSCVVIALWVPLKACHEGTSDKHNAHK